VNQSVCSCTGLILFWGVVGGGRGNNCATICSLFKFCKLAKWFRIEGKCKRERKENKSSVERDKKKTRRKDRDGPDLKKEIACVYVCVSSNKEKIIQLNNYPSRSN